MHLIKSLVRGNNVLSNRNQNTCKRKTPASRVASVVMCQLCLINWESEFVIPCAEIQGDTQVIKHYNIALYTLNAHYRLHHIDTGN